MNDFGNMTEFERELESLLNSYGLENQSNTPDFILARFILEAYQSFVRATNRRTEWYGQEKGTGETQP